MSRRGVFSFRALVVVVFVCGLLIGAGCDGSKALMESTEEPSGEEILPGDRARDFDVFDRTLKLSRGDRFVPDRTKYSALLADDTLRGDLVAQVIAKREYLAGRSDQVKEYLRIVGGKTSTNPSDLTPYLTQQAVLYLDREPDTALTAELSGLGCKILSRWVPPLENHPHGFLLVSVPINNIEKTAALPPVVLMGSAENRAEPNNDLAGTSLELTDAWSAGYDGTGVTIAILDSGLDTDHPDIPTPTYGVDCSDPENLDFDYQNTVTGHGTHIVGSAVGSGSLSGGTYQGMAPDADLLFYKIGEDTSGSATGAAQLYAIGDAVSRGADVLSMSYGGWGYFKDGSDEISQAADTAFASGTACFFPVGNEGDTYHHYEGTVAASSETDYIELRSYGTDIHNYYPVYVDLNWDDGIGISNDLEFHLYDYYETEQQMVEEYRGESTRGIEVQRSMSYYAYQPPGEGYYYPFKVKVKNNSTSSQDFHIYVIWGEWPNFDYVFYPAGSRYYTVGSPALADHAMGMGAMVTRNSWTDYTGTLQEDYLSWETVGAIAEYSSWGPRIDGYQKPNALAPGSAVVSCRDTDVYPWPGDWDPLIIDNDGTPDGNGPADYIVLWGTSSASPLAAGFAADLLEAFPILKGHPALLYDIMERSAQDITTDDLSWEPEDGYGLLRWNTARDTVEVLLDIDEGNLPIIQTVPAAFDLHVVVTVEGIEVTSGITAGQFNIRVGGASATVNSAVYDAGNGWWTLNAGPIILMVGTYDIEARVLYGKYSPWDLAEDGFSNQPGACIDPDEDGYGNPGSESCEHPEEDCDNYDPNVYPGAPEICDGKDSDCAGGPGPDEVDNDEDTYLACDPCECDDGDSNRHCNMEELCDGIDNDCDGSPGADEVDNDEDNFMICENDCNDGDPDINPDAEEICFDEIDNNCNGQIDEGCECINNHPPELLGYVYTVDDEPVAAPLIVGCGSQVGIFFAYADEDCNLPEGHMFAYLSESGWMDLGILPLELGCSTEESGLLYGFSINIDPETEPGMFPWGSYWTDVCDEPSNIIEDQFEIICDCWDNDADAYWDEACGGNDCDDGDPDIHPGAQEVCYDMVDDNCNDVLDDGCAPIVSLDTPTGGDDLMSGTEWTFAWTTQGDASLLDHFEIGLLFEGEAIAEIVLADSVDPAAESHALFLPGIHKDNLRWRLAGYDDTDALVCEDTSEIFAAHMNPDASIAVVSGPTVELNWNTSDAGVADELEVHVLDGDFDPSFAGSTLATTTSPPWEDPGSAAAPERYYRLVHPLETTTEFPTLGKKDMEIGVGYNLLGLPFLYDDELWASEVTADMTADGIGVQEISMWDNNSATWKVHDPTWPLVDFTIEPGDGFLLKSANDGTWHVAGLVVRERTVPIGMVYGYTMMGVPTDEFAMASNLAGEMIAQGCQPREISRWLANAGIWQTHEVDWPVIDYAVSFFDGYLVRADVDSTFLLNPLQIEVTSLGPSSSSITFVSDMDCWAYVIYGTNPSSLDTLGYDDTGALTVDVSHQFTLDGLAAGTYYYDIVAGGYAMDNNGDHYSFEQ